MATRRRTTRRRRARRELTGTFDVTDQGSVLLDLPRYGRVELSEPQIFMLMLFAKATNTGKEFREGYVEREPGATQTFQALVRRGLITSTGESKDRLKGIVSAKGEYTEMALRQVFPEFTKRL
ncbi:MAG: hypothetical protein K0U62_11490 [Actinomycetia bacterium]|nr:hypothetical protein [Actinomycetes bacterium]